MLFFGKVIVEILSKDVLEIIWVLLYCDNSQSNRGQQWHRPQLQLREEKGSTDHHLKYFLCHLSAPPPSLWSFLFISRCSENPRLLQPCPLLMSLGDTAWSFLKLHSPKFKAGWFFLWFYLLITPHAEDEKCCGCEVGRDSSLEYILCNEKSLLSDSRVVSSTREEHNCFGLS